MCVNIVTLNDLLPNAKTVRQAIPQFNINGYQWAETILKVANDLQKPVIVGVTDKNVEKLGGYSYVSKMIKLMIQEWGITTSIVLHLDHGQSVENCFKAVDVGFSSVMFDGSSLPLEKNIEKTKQVVKYAHNKGVSVEGEIGGIGGSEDGVIGNVKYADPEDCEKFVLETNIDALAAALGSVHGEYQGEPNLQFHVMEILNKEIDIPLVLHGASGLTNRDVRQAIDYGHAKINFNTELNLNRANALRQLFNEDPKMYDPKIISEIENKALKNVITEKLKLCYL